MQHQFNGIDIQILFNPTRGLELFDHKSEKPRSSDREFCYYYLSSRTFGKSYVVLFVYKQIAQICRIPPLTESVKRFHWFRLYSFSFQRFFVDPLIRIVCILSLLGLWVHTDRSEVGITTRIWGNEVYKQHSHVIEFYQRWIVGWILSRL
jgi:hypothetical protein